MSKIKKRILFAGAYGIENAGDDLPLIVMCEYLKNNYPKIDFTFHAFSRHPNRQEEKAYGVTMIKNLEYNSRDDAKGKWFKGLNFGDDKSDLERISKEISKSDLLILGAGNFFIDLTIDIFRGPIPLFAIYIFIAKIFHVPVMLYGISAGPIKTTWGSYLTRWIVENVDIVTVRDEESKIVLEKILYTPKKIVVLPDSTIGVRENNDRRAITILEQESIPKTGKKRIAIGLRDLTSVLGADKSKKATLELAKLLSKLGQEYEFIFIPQSTYKDDDDRVTAANFVTLLKGNVTYHLIKGRYDPRDIISLYSTCEATLAIRLHAAVFSAIGGTPVVAINYLPKVEGFMSSISQKKFLVNMNDVSANHLERKIRALLNEKRSISKTIYKKLSKKKKEAVTYSKLAYSLLKI